MSDMIAVAIVGAISAVLVAVITVFGAKLNGRLKVVQHNVQNDHTTNLRVEMDERHDQLIGWFKYLQARQDFTDRKVDDLGEALTGEIARVDALLTTLGGKR